jgi:hypothetical protein
MIGSGELTTEEKAPQGLEAIDLSISPFNLGD